ncbi:MAG: cation:dicarboxylase symporter family transporter [Proteobacteria bacterium]|nr:cation:dicarboxylase symporter family transporter [Pseudomonadota bacterium]
MHIHLSSWLKHRLFQTLFVLTVYILFADKLTPVAHQALYTISLFIKDLLLWMMPLTVGFFISNTILGFKRKAPVFILALVLFEVVSNMASVWYAYASANAVTEQLPTFSIAKLSTQFEALWRLPFNKPNWWSAQNGVLFGILFGLVVALTQQPFLIKLTDFGKDKMEWLLTKVFARLIPLFVLGFAAQIYATDLLTHVFTYYSYIVMWLLLFLAVYLIFLFTLGAGFSFSRLLNNIKALLPAGGIALTSSCSLSTMPWTIEGAAKTLQNPSLAKAIIPATTNIQQVGDCIANAFLCFLIYRHFYGANPDLATWATFSCFFVLARFATAAVLGGAIFIMLPIYETYLNFTGEMIAIILALNVVLDPIITSTNVVANGALCRVFEKVWQKFHGSKIETSSRSDYAPSDRISY